ncbi:hypothetical protein IKF43_02770 [Candidatus Saccharibacteria bacterium]|nr:hypothetical protein [Candidatus Saccharibacteria bacterium]
MSWEVRKKEENGEYILNKIVENAESYIGFLVFGPDFSSKGEIANEIRKSVPRLIRLNGVTDTEAEHIKELLQTTTDKSGVIFVMPGDESIDHDIRNEAIEWLRSFDLGIIVGVYARRAIHDESETPEVMLETNRQLTEMIENPPKVDDFDYLITVK